MSRFSVWGKKKYKLTIKGKMLGYTFGIILIMTLLSIYSLMVTNIHKEEIDEMFVRNSMLKEMEKYLTEGDQYLMAYLSTKDSSSLNMFMLNEEKLEQVTEKATEKVKRFTEEEQMILDIDKMIENYLIIANQAIDGKRKSNVTFYTEKYQASLQIKVYIQKYMNELNIRQLNRNAIQYIYIAKQGKLATLLNIALIIILIILSIIIAISMANSMINPIIRLSHSAEEMAAGQFKTEEIQVETGDELEILAKAFNRMKKNIHTYIEALKEKAYTETKLKDKEMENLKMQALLDNARLYALQSQMNPHFLFNTINAGVQIAMLEGADKTSEFLETMSRLFRYSIKQEDEVVTLRQEVENIRDYYELLKVRFGDLIQFKFQVEEESLDQHIPPLVLQPIIENAYIHGLSSLEEGGIIQLKVSYTGQVIKILVQDSGVGMTSEEVNHILSNSVKHAMMKKGSKGIGVGNVIERLKLFYKIDNPIKIESKIGLGTKIILTLPWKGQQKGRIND